jgi:hypothetical protein
MIWQHVRVAVLAGGIVVASGMSVRGEDAPPAAGAAPAAAPCPQYRTICVNEWVPENYTKCVTVYKKVCVEEKYTAYRCETVPETKTRTVQVCEYVPTEQEVVRHVCVSVPHVEQRTTYEKHWVCKPECRTERKCVDKGHYECREVPCGPSFSERAHKLLHRGGCCEDECCAPCPRTKTVKCWVPCPTWEEKTVTCMKRVCECRPVTCNVTVCRTETKEVREKVTVQKPVYKSKTETYTCNVTKRIPYEATRSVEKCVPEQKTVTCCRMVCRQVQKQVPVVTCCEEAACCKQGFFHRFGGHGGHSHGCCD